MIVLYLKGWGIKFLIIYDFSEFTYETGSDAGKTIELKKVFHETPPAIVRYFDPFVGTGLGSQQLLENFG